MRGTGTVFLRWKVWWIQHNLRGRRYRESSKSTLKRDALVLLRTRLAEVGAGREFPFGPFPALQAVIEERRRVTSGLERDRAEIIPWVFHRDGARIKCMRKGWEGAARRAGIPGSWFHDLRRTAVRNLELAGVPRSVAMKLTGHKTESVYLRYAITERTALQEGVERLARLHRVLERDASQHVLAFTAGGTPTTLPGASAGARRRKASSSSIPEVPLEPPVYS